VATPQLSTVTHFGGAFASIALAGTTPLLAIDIVHHFNGTTINGRDYCHCMKLQFIGKDA
jgi:hypothetical protein